MQIPLVALERISKVMRKHGRKPPATFQAPDVFWEEVANFIDWLDGRLDDPPPSGRVRGIRRCHG